MKFAIGWGNVHMCFFWQKTGIEYAIHALRRLFCRSYWRYPSDLMPERYLTAWMETWLIKNSEILIPQFQLQSESFKDHSIPFTDESVIKSQEANTKWSYSHAMYGVATLIVNDTIEVKNLIHNWYAADWKVAGDLESLGIVL